MLIGEYESHPLADAFPSADQFRIASLADSIGVNGLRVKIVRWEGKILDGRTRLAALLHAGIDVTESMFREFGTHESDGADPVQFVWDMNGERRDLTDFQRVSAARRLESLRRKLAKDVRVGRKQRSLPIDQDAAEHVSDVRSSGVPSLVGAMEAGEVSAETAAAIAKLSPENQERVLKRSAESDAKEPRRAQTWCSIVEKLSEMDVLAVRALLSVAENSKHGEVRAGAAVIRRVLPWL